MTPRANGTILISEHEYAGGGRHLEYTWEGGPIAAFSHELLRQSPDIFRREGAFINVGPFHLRVVEDQGYGDPILGQVVCVREGPRAWYVRLYNFSTDIWRRIIITLAVWGLADYHEATIPHLGNIHFVQWLRKHMTESEAG